MGDWEVRRTTRPGAGATKAIRAGSGIAGIGRAVAGKVARSELLVPGILMLKLGGGSRMGTRNRIRVRIAAGICLAGSLAAAQIGRADPVDCPMVGAVLECVLIVGPTEFVVTAGKDLVVDSWRIDGIRQIANGVSGFSIRDFTSQGISGTEVRAARVDSEASTIFVEIGEIDGPLSISVRFQVTQVGNRSAVTEELAVASTSDRTVETRIYAMVDFNLDGTPTDQSIVAMPDGTRITQADGPVAAEFAVGLGAPPDAWEVALCCVFDELIVGALTVDLDPSATVEGPGDFQAAMSWDRALPPGGAFAVTLAKAVTAPEPGPAATALAALGMLAALSLGGSRVPRGLSAPESAPRRARKSTQMPAS